MSEVELHIIAVVDKLRPFLMSDGGMIDFVKFENGIAYVKLSGACSECSLMEYTLKDGIEVAITSEVPEVVEVRNVI
ncbi:MAG: NifU family protein [Bacilli bacterium]